MKIKPLALCLLFLAACGDLDEAPSGKTTPTDEEQENFAISFLDGIQQRTFEANREFCGFFGVDRSGKIVATEPSRGELDSCLPPEADASVTVFASYHSHGAFDPEVDSEVPSLADLKADVEENVDGFIGTPGGRVWVNDFEDRIAYLLCEECIEADEAFEPELFGPVEESYTIAELEERFGE